MENTLKEDLKSAQLNRDQLKVSVLRLLLSELNYARISKGNELQDQDIVAVIQKEIKKRKEAAEGFRSGNREEDAKKEEAEALVLKSYLPEQLSDEELTKVVIEAINEVGATTISDMGRVIGMVREKVGVSADGARISGIVKEKLTN